MKLCLIEYQKAIKNIELFLTGIDLHNSLLTWDYHPNEELEDPMTTFKEHFTSFRLKRVFDYNSTIIFLYGAFEQYIENLIKSYLKFLNKIIHNYNNLPDKILKTHFHFSADLIKNLDLPKYQNAISKEKIVENLHSCSSTPGTYTLNYDAYTYHKANFRFEIINDFYSTVGIEQVSIKIKKHPKIIEYLSENLPDIDTITEQIAFEKINDLALRRNDIAHGVQTDTILSNEILYAYLKYFKIYGEALYDIINSETLPYIIDYKADKLNVPINVFNGKIICLRIENVSIAKGDIIIAKSSGSKPKYYSSEIKNLQINRISIQKIKTDTYIDIGIEVNFNAKMNYELFLFRNIS